MLARRRQRIIVPPPTPKDGIANFVNQVGQTGLIVVVVIAAGALAFDARRGLSTFLRIRADSMWTLVGPRFTVNAAAAVLAYTLGTLAAWYETAVLLGSPPAGAMLAGLLCGSVYLIFAVAVVTAAASVARSTLGTVGIALAALLVLPILGSLTALHSWLPSTRHRARPVAHHDAAERLHAALLVATGTSVILVSVARTAARQTGGVSAASRVSSPGRSPPA